jgi:ABC-type multidrug transport system fused ATPase/permease subunit
VSKIRVDLHRHLTGMSPRAVQRSSQGALLLRFTGDLSTLRTWLSRGLARGIVASITLMGGLGVLFFAHVLIGVAVLGILLVGASVSLVAGDRVRRATRAVRWRRSLLASHIAEQIHSLAVVQVFGRTAGERDRLATQNDDLVRALDRMAVTRGRLRLASSGAGSLSVCAVLMVGAYAIPRQLVTVGDVVAAMAAVRFLSGPIRVLGRVNEYWHAGQVSKRKLNDFFGRPARELADPGLERLRPRAGRIELRNVSVAGVLDDVSLTVEGGQMLAITGPNGAGKSTLLSLISRFVEPDGGEILIDDQVLAECTPQSTYRHLGIVSPDLPLMRGTVRRNLSYRYRAASDEELDRVVMSCRIDELVEELPGGLSAWLTEGGTNISVGQRQRILLGRAILGNPRLLLLDEPTTNLDPATMEIFRRVLARYRGTVMLVTHDPVEAALADHVCVMANGRIEEYMTADEYRSRAHTIRRVEAGRVRW